MFYFLWIQAWAEITKFRCDLSKHCHKANLFVKPRKGTAILWYNHLRDEKTGWHGRLDEMTYHGGCDIIKGEKWIANNWINILGDSRETMVSYKNPKKKIKWEALNCYCFRITLKKIVTLFSASSLYSSSKIKERLGREKRDSENVTELVFNNALTPFLSNSYFLSFQKQF